MKYEMTLIQAPSGRYIWVGTIPAELAYQTIDGSKLTDALIDSELRLPASYRKRIKSVSFETAEEAYKAASKYLERSLPCLS